MKTKSSAILIAAGLSLMAFLSNARAVSPAPDGCYPNYTTAEGCNALRFLTTGAGNTGVGWYSLFSNTDASFNTGVGGGALALNNGASNTAIGTAAMLLNTSGGSNTAVGTDALLYNDNGFSNTGLGDHALFNNVSGDRNTAVGQATLSANIDGNHNTATGQFAMLSNDHGDENTANGYQALAHNTGGAFNVAVGDNALFSNTTGQSNTAVGSSAGFNQTDGIGNVYIGDGVAGVAGESGHTYIRNINGTNVSGGNADFVTVDLMTGLLGHATSSRRYKENIQPMDKASEALHRLKPVTYHYKKEIDPSESPAFGLIAEEVAEVNPDLVARNARGEPEAVHYEMINAMLLNEFLKEHRTVQEQDRRIQEQETTIAELKKEMATVVARLTEQDAKIQKVNDTIELTKAARQAVAENGR
jgi:hypothetical protein